MKQFIRMLALLIVLIPFGFSQPDPDNPDWSIPDPDNPDWSVPRSELPPDDSSEPPIEWSKIEESGLGELFFDTETCPYNTFTLPQTGRNGIGGGEGLASNTVQPTIARAYSTLPASIGREKSTLIIVDDFRFSSQYEDDEQQIHNALNWVITGSGRRLSTAQSIMADPRLTNREREAGLYGINVSHGSLVLFYALRLLEQASINPDPSTARLISPDAYHIPMIGADVEVIAVDTNDFNTADIARVTNETIDWVRDRNLNTGIVNRITVNMSFGLVPCALLQDFKNRQADPTANIDTFADYKVFFEDVSRITGFNVNQWRRQLTLAANLSPDPDPLRELAELYAAGEVLGSNSHIAFVASAGNYNASFPVYPAAWQYFISVGAFTVNGIPPYSNYADVMTIGDVEVTPSVSVSGTSFAAPLVSVAATLDLTTSPTPFCDYARQGQRELDHWDPDANTSFRGLINIPLQDAVANICP